MLIYDLSQNLNNLNDFLFQLFQMIEIIIKSK